MVTGMDDETVVNGASIATAFLNHHIRSGQNAVPKNFLAQGCEIGPSAGLRRRPFGNNAGNHLVALPKLHRFAGPQPSLEPLGVTKLADVYAGHNEIVSQCVTHCQMPCPLRATACAPAVSGYRPPPLPLPARSAPFVFR